MARLWSCGDGDDAESYDDRWQRLEEEGQSVHGEADLVAAHDPVRVLDAGCGTGRVAIELHRRGIDVVGADVDATMLARARTKAPDLAWHEADLSTLDLRDDAGTRETFDAIVLAGNVMIFLEPGSEGTVIERLAEHLVPGGVLIAGFQLLSGRLTIDDFDSMSERAGIRPVERYSTWGRDPFVLGGDYAVSVGVKR